jgi:hypothetical protein
MSTEEDKIKHSKRLHKEEAAIKRQAKIAKAYGIPVKETHVLSKHHAIDFGREIGLKFSNPRKSEGEETIQEKRFKQAQIELDFGPQE